MAKPSPADGDDSEAAPGRRLRALRTSRGVSLRAAAALANIAPGALSQIERGDNPPATATAPARPAGTSERKAGSASPARPS